MSKSTTATTRFYVELDYKRGTPCFAMGVDAVDKTEAIRIVAKIANGCGFPSTPKKAKTYEVDKNSI